jgi:hypothetical protein
MRIVRSSLLVVKVLTIPRVCLDPTMRPRPVVAALLLGAAVVDTVINHDEMRAGCERSEERRNQRRWWRNWGERRLGSVWITVGLAVFHASVLGVSTLLDGTKAPDSGSWDWWGKVCCIPLDGAGEYRSVPIPI